MNRPKALFENSCRGETIIVTPTANLTEFAYDKLEDEATAVLELLEKPDYRNVVIDLSRTDYCSSSAMGLFLKIWKNARSRDGAMAFCGLSEHEEEIFRTMRLDELWPVCPSLEAALEAVGG